MDEQEASLSGRSVNNCSAVTEIIGIELSVAINITMYFIDDGSIFRRFAYNETGERSQ